MASLSSTSLGARLDALQRAHAAELIDNDEYRFLRKQAFIHLASSSGTGRDPSKPGPSRASSLPGPGLEITRSARPSPKKALYTSTSFLDIPDGRNGILVDSPNLTDQHDIKKDRRRSWTQWVTNLSPSKQPDSLGSSSSLSDIQARKPSLSRRTSSIFGNENRSRQASPTRQQSSEIEQEESDLVSGRGRVPSTPRTRSEMTSKGSLAPKADKDEDKNKGRTSMAERRRSWISPSIGTSASSLGPPSSQGLSKSKSATPSKAKPDLGRTGLPPSSFRATSIIKPLARSTSSTMQLARPASEHATTPSLTLLQVQTCTSPTLLQTEWDKLAVEEWELRRAYEEVEDGIWKSVGGSVMREGQDIVRSGANVVGLDIAIGPREDGNGTSEHLSADTGGTPSKPKRPDQPKDRPLESRERRSFMTRTRSRMFDVFRRSSESHITSPLSGSPAKKEIVAKNVGVSPDKEMSVARSDGSLEDAGYRKSTVTVVSGSLGGLPTASGIPHSSSGSTPSHGRSDNGISLNLSEERQPRPPSRTRFTHPSSPTLSHHTNRPGSYARPPSVLSAGALSILQAQQEQEQESLEQKMDKLQRLKGFKEDLGRRYEERKCWVEVRLKALELQERARRS